MRFAGARNRWLVYGAWVAGGLGLAAGLGLTAVWCYFHPSSHWQRGVVYGERHGHALTIDVLTPTRPSGIGVVFMVSGGWKSGTNSFRPWLVAPLLRQGFTVFAVYHLSQPEATVMEIVADVSRAVRFIRAHAADYGIDPDRLGATGGSAGGHLSLMLATRGGLGPPDATDPVDRASSAVQAVAIFFPVTDLTDLSGSTEDPGDGGPPKNFRRAFDQEPVDLTSWQVVARELSPLHHVTAALPPTLIYHGDCDTLVTLSQSERFRQRADDLGARVNLVTVRCGGHGWLTMPFQVIDAAAWLTEQLKRSR